MRCRASSVSFAALLAVACGGGGDGGPPDAGPLPGRPVPPEQNDPAFAVTRVPAYLLAGDDLTPATASFSVRVTPPAGVLAVDLYVDDGDAVALAVDGADLVATVDAAALAIGEHTLLLAEPGAEVGFFAATFVKGHALYVMISTDWDFPDVDNRVLTDHDDLHAAHPELKITHLIGPYTFTDAAVSQARRDEIVAWALRQEADYGDEIGLHVHPRCTFVEDAGLTCLTMPSVAYPAGDVSGYTVQLGAYTRAEWDVLFAHAGQIFATAGLPQPVSFRAGAWTLELHVAQALADAGFVADSSALNWQYMEEWLGYDIYDWNMQQWAAIGDTSQPYYPTDDSVQPGGAGAPLTMLEIPDNGIMVDYWTLDEMIGVFEANWSGQALEAPAQVSTGFHPAPTAYYTPDEITRLDAFFTYVDAFLASQLAGPVIYIRMSDAPVVWPM